MTQKNMRSEIQLEISEKPLPWHERIAVFKALRKENVPMRKSLLLAGVAGVLIAGMAKPAAPRRQARVMPIRYFRKPVSRDNDTLRDRIAGSFGESVTRYGGGTSRPRPKPANVPSPPRSNGVNIGPLLAVISKAEAKSYDTIWGGIKRSDYPSQRLTQMTIGEVLDWQDSIDRKYMSEASGKYQFMEDTLRRIYKKAGLSRNSPFNAANQDKLALVLIKEAGLARYKSGSLTVEQFGDKLARVWAGLPVHSRQRGQKRTVDRGQSYYAGDSLNRATVSPEAVASAIRRV